MFKELLLKKELKQEKKTLQEKFRHVRWPIIATALRKKDAVNKEIPITI